MDVFQYMNQVVFEEKPKKMLFIHRMRMRVLFIRHNESRLFE